MKKRVLLPTLVAGLGLSLLLVAFSQPVQADPDNVLVDRATGIDQPGCGDGINPPCYSIRYAAENVAVAGDSVLVTAGTYTANG